MSVHNTTDDSQTESNPSCLAISIVSKTEKRSGNLFMQLLGDTGPIIVDRHLNSLSILCELE
jgi:hypothetical protein